MALEITVWYLSSCSTCLRILKELSFNENNSVLIDIKKNNISAIELKKLKRV